MNYATLRVPVQHVARVDRALAREGLAVISRPDHGIVVRGESPPEVPRVLAYDGPRGRFDEGGPR